LWGIGREMDSDLKIWRTELLRHIECGEPLCRVSSKLDRKPVLIVAGACDARDSEALASVRAKIEHRLADFSGHLISGGTRTGVCGLVGELSEAIAPTGRKWRSTGYLPQKTADELVDQRYDRLVFTEGASFSEMEPLQYWTDILAAGMKGVDVALLRHDGGRLSSFEEDLALALGADVSRI